MSISGGHLSQNAYFIRQGIYQAGSISWNIYGNPLKKQKSTSRLLAVERSALHFNQPLAR